MYDDITVGSKPPLESTGANRVLVVQLSPPSVDLARRSSELPPGFTAVGFWKLVQAT
jgi:hypothetical protein